MSSGTPTDGEAGNHGLRLSVYSVLFRFTRLMHMAANGCTVSGMKRHDLPDPGPVASLSHIEILRLEISRWTGKPVSSILPKDQWKGVVDET